MNREISFRRHYVFLGLACVLMLAVRQLWPLAAPAKLALYGALHAVSVVMAVPGRERPATRIAFVVLAAALSPLALYCGLLAARALEVIISGHLVMTASVLASSAGAATYGAVLQRLWAPRLAMPTLAGMVAACAASTGMAVLGFAGTPWLLEAVSVFWWFVFSAGWWLGLLSEHCGRRAAPRRDASRAC